ncbi:MAG: hypothetical protein ACKOAZ_05420 [Ilumatobacteraceae bacterium]
MQDPRSMPPLSAVDSRDLKAGHMVSDRNGYYDSQNIVAVGAQSGQAALSVVLHHSENREGGPGLQLFSTRSVDGGRTWSPLAPIDDGARQSHDGYQLLHRRSDGSERIFVFYGWNEGSQYPAGSPVDLPELKRTDMQLDDGYWFRVSDDGGVRWGDRRWLIPVRRTRIDRDNPWGGSTMGMFLCDKPSVIDGSVYVAFQKTRDGAGETPGSEVFFLRSRNLLHVDDLDDAEWETLPHGDAGLQSPSGDLALGEEPHVLQVGAPHPDRLFCLWRAETGRLAAAYSDDGGETWGESFWLTHEGHAGGVQPLKNPRGSITPFRLREPSARGLPEFVMLYYNNGRTERLGYVGRRVYWLVCGRSTPDGLIRWGQPELALWWDGTGFEDRPGWNPDWAIVDGPGYPDFVEFDDGTLAFVESNKLAVRYHVVDRRLLAHLRAQPELVHVTDDSLAYRWHAAADVSGRQPCAPALADLRARGGVTVVVRIAGTGAAARGRCLVQAFSTVTAALGEEPTSATVTKGYSVTVRDDGELELYVTDGFGTEVRHSTRIAMSSNVWDGGEHLVGFVLDGGPKVVSAVVDERLDDGGSDPQGWAFFPAALGEVGGSELVVEPNATGVLRELRVYDRALLTTELVAASRSAIGE